jgi:acetyl coenzyme A synthetase (ADP forming)-like protein
MMVDVHSVLESERLILRDGTSSPVHVASSADAEALRVFFEGLSSEARFHRFFSSRVPSAKEIEALCDSSDPRKRLTLIVTRILDGAPRIIAAGSYLARDTQTAEVAFAVGDAFQGKGLGSLLLERLALVAVRHGFVRFWAVTHPDNQAMRELFRDSGFPVHESFEGEYMEVDLSVVPSDASQARSDMRERVATTASLRPLFRPQSVAVVGASRESTSIGHRLLDALVMNRFQGPVYPVNPKASVVGCIKAYPSVRELPEAVDLAIIVVPRRNVLQVVDECAERGVKALIVISSGFAEADLEGRELQARLVEKVRGYGMRLVGPNCMGLLNTDPNVQLNATFSALMPPHGRVAMASQSGALGLALLSAARRFNLGLSSFVSMGNKADISGNDLLQYWEEDAATEVILLYLESFGNPRRFARIARRIGRRKPIIVVKGGRTGAGQRAAGSHTAALASSEVAVDTLFRQTGVLRADTLEEMFDLAALLGSQPLPQGQKVAIVSNAGGPAILCVDMCEAGGLSVPEFSETVKARLKAFVSPMASVKNPVDLIASATPQQFRQAVETLLAAEEVSAVIVIYIPIETAATEAVVNAVREGVAAGRKAGGSVKPVLACLMAEQGVRTQLVLPTEQIPCFAFPEAAARVLVKAAAYAAWRVQEPGKVPEFADVDLPLISDLCLKAGKERGETWLSAEETRAVLTAMRLPVLPGGVAKHADEAVALARRIGFPVAVKLASRLLVHKTEAGGVQLNLQDEAGVHQAYDRIRQRLVQDDNLKAMEGVLVQPMVPAGVEVMVGMTEDPLFGPIIAFGLGGIYVEILQDVCFRITPLTDRDAAEMIRGIRGHRLLDGYRGHPPADLGALHEVLLRVSRLAEEVPEIREIDLNPIFALPPTQGCRIADARIKVRIGR